MEIIARHEQEMRDAMGTQYRDVGTAAFAGLTVPQYLVDQAVPLARAGFPLYEHVSKLALPLEGLTVTISRLTTG
ncbi:MAG: hypothetical protein NZL88_11495, partial [Gaiellaceae bacterium]|nr:hypothetical protein [Gaiellaceae bacterium]